MEFWRFIGNNSNFEDQLIGNHNIYLVVLSSLVASFAAYAALSVVDRAKISTKLLTTLTWLTVGAFAMGSGVWAMHFIAMLSFTLPVPISYNLPITLISVIPAIFGSGVALQFMYQDSIQWRGLHLSGLLMAVGIGTMHYLGMEAIRLDALLFYDPTLFVISILVAYALATFALYIKFLQIKFFSTPAFWVKVGSAVLMGNAVAGMHYTAMSAAIFYPGSGDSIHVATLSPMAMGITICVIVFLIIGLVIISTLIDRRLAKTAKSLKDSNDFSRMLLDSAGDGIIGLDLNGRTTFVNPSATNMLGYSSETLLDQPLHGLIPHQHTDGSNCNQAECSMFAVIYDGKVHTSKGVYLKKDDGTSLPIDCTSTPILGEGKLVGAVLSFRDITERKQAEDRLQNAKKELETRVVERTAEIAKTNERLISEISERKRAEKALEEQAVRDILTGLYNRRSYNSQIVEEISRANRKKQVLALLLCDLDGFKSINDTQGHQFGDEVLKEVANSIRKSVRGFDTVFRWGGDEFVVLLLDTSREGVQIASERIRNGVLNISENGYSGLDVSIGVSLYPEHGTHPDNLVHMADRALYIAKKGGEKVHIGEEEYLLDDSSIDVVFQPVMDVRLNLVLGYEALSRDPQGKQSIFALFKKYHAIGKLHELKCLCFRLQIKAAQEAQVEKLFINVDFKMLKRTDIPPLPDGMDIVLEISEGEVLEDVEDALKVAQLWRKYGYKFAMDDFGAGFVSLPFIARLIPDHIKLDRSTILQAVNSKGFRSILQDLLHALRKTSTDGIIAEGIETEKELSIMKNMGITLIQGYLFGKPEALKPPLPFHDNNLSPEINPAHRSVTNK